MREERGTGSGDDTGEYSPGPETPATSGVCALPGAERIADPYRLKVIADLGFAGQDGDIHLDAVLRTLTAACGVPIAALNVVTPGRQTYAAELGLGEAFIALDDELSFCAWVVTTGEALVVADAPEHAVLRHNPFVLKGAIGSYAGEPVVHRGVVVGALGIFDGRPRVFTDAELTVLHQQARLVEMILTMRTDSDRTNAVMLRSLIDHSESLTYVKDLQGRYLLANPMMEQVFSVTEAELLGRTAADLDPSRGPGWQANDQRALRGTLHVDEFVDLPDGRHVYESVKYPLVDVSGRVYATAGVSLDVTAKRRVAQAVADARDAAMAASRQKSSFLATMSHEIRTPMNAVIGMTGLLLDTPLDGQQQEFVETVRTSGESLLSIINDILDFSKIEAGSLRLEHRPFELLTAVEDAAELVGATAVAEDLELVVHVDPRCPSRVVGDPTRLGQVLVNLIRNAVKFTPRGEVLVTVEPAGPADAPAGAVDLRFSVADTGIGILADRQESMFESFSQVDASTTRQYGGTGLGLAISRRLVEAMGGRLSVDSALGVGSTFSFTVALADPTRPGGAPGAAGTPRPVADLLERSVLLVDDNATSRRVLRSTLQSWGMRVTEAAGGVAAADRVASGAGFDVVLIDGAMPGMSGLDLARHLRALPATASLPLVLVGPVLVGPRGRGRPEESDLFRAVVAKPVRRRRLEDGLRAALATVGGGEARPAPASAAGDVLAPGSLHVLLAEDNAVNQRLGLLMLSKLGHRVDVVGNGHDAAEAVRHFAYDAVLMDVEMPVLDGLEATRRIRSEVPPPRQPQIVALTASALVEDRQACLAAGMDDHLGKPVRLSDLAAALTRVAVRIGSRGVEAATGC